MRCSHAACTAMHRSEGSAITFLSWISFTGAHESASLGPEKSQGPQSEQSVPRSHSTVKGPSAEPPPPPRVGLRRPSLQTPSLARAHVSVQSLLSTQDLPPCPLLAKALAASLPAEVTVRSVGGSAFWSSPGGSPSLRNTISTPPFWPNLIRSPCLSGCSFTCALFTNVPNRDWRSRRTYCSPSRATSACSREMSAPTSRRSLPVRRPSVNRSLSIGT